MLQKHESQQSWNAARIDWIEADAMDLKYADDTFDAATMGYGLRNVRTHWRLYHICFLFRHTCLKKCLSLTIDDTKNTI